jgi:peroxiredoxin
MHAVGASGELVLNNPAPDFELADYRGRVIMLSEFRGKQHVLLVLNRGFA